MTSELDVKLLSLRRDVINKRYGNQKVDVRSSIKRYKDTTSLGVNFDSHGKAIINNYKRAFRDELAKAGLLWTKQSQVSQKLLWYERKSQGTRSRTHNQSILKGERTRRIIFCRKSVFSSPTSLPKQNQKSMEIQTNDNITVFLRALLWLQQPRTLRGGIRRFFRVRNPQIVPPPHRRGHRDLH